MKVLSSSGCYTVAVCSIVVSDLIGKHDPLKFQLGHTAKYAGFNTVQSFRELAPQQKCYLR